MNEIKLPDVKILCCNYFRGIDIWEFKNVVRPYWRFYWNETPGAFIRYNRKEIELSPDIFVLIPPYTDFSTYCTRKFSQLYLHFTAGEPFTLTKRKILTFNAAETLRMDIKTSKEQLLQLKDSQSKESMLIYSLIFDALLKINKNDFLEKPSLDSRVKLATDIMHEHFSEILSNQDICEKIHMSQTNFIRLFRKELNISPQKYLRLIRIEKATYMLCYTGHSIEKIAEMTGFTDRYHFSRVFKSQRNISPAAYRKQMKPLK